jgi:hypothetical protein
MRKALRQHHVSIDELLRSEEGAIMHVSKLLF